MPKVKTNSSAKKRFKVTGTGLVTFQKPFKRHILTKKSTKGKRKNVYTVAKNVMEKGLTYSYVGRKLKKREYRTLWIARINAAVRAEGITYSEFIHKLAEKNIDINRKVLADLAMNEPESFKS